MVVSSELANSPCSRLQKQKSSAPLRDHCCGQVTWQVLPLLWSSHLAGTGHMGSGSGEGVPLDLLPALYLSVDAPLLVQSSSATLPNLSRPQLWSSHLAGAHEKQAFDHRCGRVAKLALERRRVQQRCPRAPTPEPGEGRRPKNRQSQRRKVVLPGCSVFSLSWPACAWSLLVPGRWFSGPAPSGSSLFWFRLMFLSIGRGRHVSQEGRRVSAGAPTQEPAQGADPRTGFCRYPSAYGFVVYLVAPGLFFPLHFAILLWRSWHCFPCMLELFGRLDSGSASFSTTRSSNGSFTQAASSYHPVVFLPSCQITPPAFQCSLASQKILSSLNDGYATIT